jgi:hypothetical protein
MGKNADFISIRRIRVADLDPDPDSIESLDPHPYSESGS